MDNFKNFAKVTVSTGYDAAATSIALTAGHGTRLPAAPFNATWWNSTDYPDPSDDPNAEIVRVTAIATDTLTVTRAQESTTASTKNTASKTYKMIAGLTAKTFNSDLIGVAAPDALQVVSGRLTLESGMPLSFDDQMAKSTIYFTPYKGNRISLYDGTKWNVHTFSEISLDLTLLLASRVLLANTVFDVFVYDNAGTLALDLSTAWATDNTRAEALALQDGVYVRASDHTQLFLGTFRTVTATTTEDSKKKRFLWNNANRIMRDLFYEDLISHTYDNSAGPRMWAGNPLAYVALVTGLRDNPITMKVGADTSSTGAVYVIAGGGVNFVSAYRGAEVYVTNVATKISVVEVVEPFLGYQQFNLIQRTFGGTGTFATGNITVIFSA